MHSQPEESMAQLVVKLSCKATPLLFARLLSRPYRLR